MMTITLPEELEKRLHREALRRGVEPAEYARELIENSLPHPAAPAAGDAPPAPPGERPHPDQATLDVLDRWEKETATDDPEELARRQQEFEEFKAAMNRNRLEMEGPNSRKLFP